MKTLDKIPVTKFERAGKLVQTGVKLGGNYVKYYGNKMLNADNYEKFLECMKIQNKIDNDKA